MEQTNNVLLNEQQQRFSKFLLICALFGVVLVLMVNFSEQFCVRGNLNCRPTQQWQPAILNEMDLMKRFEAEDVGIR